MNTELGNMLKNVIVALGSYDLAS